MTLRLLGILNFWLLQLFFVRLAMVFNDDDQHVGYTWLTGIVPFTGWWSPYIRLKGIRR